MKIKMKKSKYSIIILILIAALGLYEYYTASSGKPDIYGSGNEFGDELLSVYYIDVGQGDCTLLVSGGDTMLIDAGEKSAKALKKIEELGIRELTYVVATHPHSDHIGGISDVIRKMPPDHILMPDATHTSQTFEELLDTIESLELKITVPKPGDTFALGEATITVLSPDGDYVNLNNYSIVLRAAAGDKAFLFMGDAEALIERQLLDSGHNLAGDVLKVGHHGSNTSSTDEFLKAVYPEYAIISCGLDNDYDHPSDKVVKRLKDLGVKILSTAASGTIAAYSDGKTVRIEELQ